MGFLEGNGAAAGGPDTRVVGNAPDLVETPLTDIQASVVSPSLMRHGASPLLQLVNGAIARDWLRDLLERANTCCEAH